MKRSVSLALLVAMLTHEKTPALQLGGAAGTCRAARSVTTHAS